MELRQYGSVEAIKNLYNAYRGQQAPPLPKKMSPPKLPTIDLVEPSKGLSPAHHQDNEGMSSVPSHLIIERAISSAGPNDSRSILSEPIATDIRQHSAQSHSGVNVGPTEMMQDVSSQQNQQLKQESRFPSGIAWYRPSYQMDYLHPRQTSTSHLNRPTGIAVVIVCSVICHFVFQNNHLQN